MGTRIIAQFPRSRAVSYPINPEQGDDIIVERLTAAGEWERVCGYNSLSNDYAYTSARDHAERLSRREP